MQSLEDDKRPQDQRDLDWCIPFTYCNFLYAAILYSIYCLR